MTLTTNPTQNMTQSLFAGQSSIYPIPPVPRQALAVSISEPETLRDAEEAIRVAFAMAYALKSGAFAPRLIQLLRINVLGMSQATLAERISYSQSAVRNWELGEREIAADAYLAIIALVRDRLEHNARLIAEGHAMRQHLGEPLTPPIPPAKSEGDDHGQA
jgi:DNA-binding transcriptional regulator YiaG